MKNPWKIKYDYRVGAYSVVCPSAKITKGRNLTETMARRLAGRLNRESRKGQSKDK